MLQNLINVIIPWHVRFITKLIVTSRWTSIVWMCSHSYAIANSPTKIRIHSTLIWAHLQVCLHEHKYMYMYVCGCMYRHGHLYSQMNVCVYIHMHTHTNTQNSDWQLGLSQHMLIVQACQLMNSKLKVRMKPSEKKNNNNSEHILSLQT